jgi:hypothetical protein
MSKCIIMNGWENEKGKQLLYLARSRDNKEWEWTPERQEARKLEPSEASALARKYGGKPIPCPT